MGKGGKAMVAGFNVPNRVQLKDASRARSTRSPSSASTGPISAAPTNWIFLKDTYLDIEDKK